VSFTELGVVERLMTANCSSSRISPDLSLVVVLRSLTPPPLIARRMASLSGFPPNFVKAGFIDVAEADVGGGGGAG
jgi:hypothetical protein